MTRKMVFTPDAPRPPATYSQAVSAKLPIRPTGMKISVAIIAVA